MRRIGDSSGATAGLRLERARFAAPDRSEPERSEPIASPIALTFKRASAIAEQLGLSALECSIRSMSTERIRSAIRRTEKVQRRPVPSKVVSMLIAAKAGEMMLFPINHIRPGQSDLSLVNVRQKMLNFVERIEEQKDAADMPQSLLAYEEALTAVVGPGGRYIVLTDGHHHIAALKAVESVVSEIIGDSLSLSPTNRATRPAQEIQAVRSLFGGRAGVPNVPITITKNLSHLGEKEFWRTMRAENLTYAARRRGRTARIPKTFGALADNPFRWLAAITTGKMRVLDDGDGEPYLKMTGAEYPVWLKRIGKVPPFIELLLAEVLRDAFEKLGIKYDPEAALTKEVRSAVRCALLFARANPKHRLRDALARLPILSKDVSSEDLEDRIEPRANGDLEIPKRFVKPGKRRLRRLEAWAGEVAKARKRPGLELAGGPLEAKKRFTAISSLWRWP
jgi:hypothetical protein